MKSFIIACLLAVSVVSAAQIQLSSYQDLQVQSNQYGSHCTSETSYQLDANQGGAQAIRMAVDWDLTGINKQFTSATIQVIPSSCVGGDRINVEVASYDPTYSFNAADLADKSTRAPNAPYGYNCDLDPNFNTIGALTFDAACAPTNSLDITAVLNAALAANNKDLALGFRSRLRDFNDAVCRSSGNYSGINCDVVLPERTAFALVLNYPATTTVVPTTTVAPTTTGAQTTTGAATTTIVPTTTAAQTTTVVPTTTGAQTTTGAVTTTGAQTTTVVPTTTGAVTTTVVPTTTTIAPTLPKCPTKGNTQASNTCLANQSGGNNASRRLRQGVAACSGNGSCDSGNLCICKSGYYGVDCASPCSTVDNTNLSGNDNAKSGAVTVTVSVGILIVAFVMTMM